MGLSIKKNPKRDKKLYTIASWLFLLAGIIYAVAALTIPDGGAALQAGISLLLWQMFKRAAKKEALQIEKAPQESGGKDKLK